MSTGTLSPCAATSGLERKLSLVRFGAFSESRIETRTSRTDMGVLTSSEMSCTQPPASSKSSGRRVMIATAPSSANSNEASARPRRARRCGRNVSSMTW